MDFGERRSLGGTCGVALRAAEKGLFGPFTALRMAAKLAVGALLDLLFGQLLYSTFHSG